MGSMVTRFRIEDASGLIMTVHGEFAYDDNGYLAEFSSEEEALECADALVGSMAGLSVERFDRWSHFPEVSNEQITERAAA